jgi:hypothetical protein
MLFTYLTANFRDQEDGVAQRSPALHSAGSLCVRLSYGRRNGFIFDFCLRAIPFLSAADERVHRLLK